ncbi:LysE family translocator [Namhaeicola litoreus]|uniref:LysE family translocator n=1 Tax=Namhaeicola litoreus TaxID=1052145 RepID=A0ABW3Y0P7_9FLAO
MLNESLNAILLGIGLAFMIGPVFFTLIETSVTKGARAAIVFDLGVILADISFISLAYFGSVGFLERIQNDSRVYLFGGLVLIAFGVFTIVKKSGETGIANSKLRVNEPSNYLKLFLKGFFLNFINVGVLAFWFAVVIAVTASLELDKNKIIQYFATTMITFFVIDLFKIVVSKQLKSKLTPIVLHKMQFGLGIVFIVFGLILAAKRFIPLEI